MREFAAVVFKGFRKFAEGGQPGGMRRGEGPYQQHQQQQSASSSSSSSSSSSLKGGASPRSSWERTTAAVGDSSSSRSGGNGVIHNKGDNWFPEGVSLQLSAVGIFPEDKDGRVTVQILGWGKIDVAAEEIRARQIGRMRMRR